MCVTYAAIRSIKLQSFIQLQRFIYHAASCYPFLRNFPTIPAFLCPFFGQMSPFPNKALCTVTYHIYFLIILLESIEGLEAFLKIKMLMETGAFQNAQFPFLSFKIKILTCKKARCVMESIKVQRSSVSTLVPPNTILENSILSHRVA